MEHDVYKKFSNKKSATKTKTKINSTIPLKIIYGFEINNKN